MDKPAYTQLPDEKEEKSQENYMSRRAGKSQPERQMIRREEQGAELDIHREKDGVENEPKREMEQGRSVGQQGCFQYVPHHRSAISIHTLERFSIFHRSLPDFPRCNSISSITGYFLARFSK
jgi:hypothetical protein